MNKLIISVVIDSRGRFYASDNLFYDYGIGDSLHECLRDYAITLSERYDISRKIYKRYQKKIKKLGKLLQK